MKMKDESKKDKNAWHGVWHERLDEQHVKYADKDTYTSYEMYIRIVDMRECLFLPQTRDRATEQWREPHKKKMTRRSFLLV